MGKIRLFPLLFKMVAPRALVFRPLVRGNEDSGKEIDFSSFIYYKSTYDQKNTSFQKYAHLKDFSKYNKMTLFFFFSFFFPEIFKFSHYANLVTDDVTGCASAVV